MLDFVLPDDLPEYDNDEIDLDKDDLDGDPNSQIEIPGTTKWFLNLFY